MTATAKPLVKKDYKSDQDIRWCPGCGDYAVLNAVQSAFAKLGKSLHETVIISGIGCSSRFPYYMETYGFHTIHGRAPTIATGVKVNNPDLDVWVITGDGDALSIGGNHFIHTLRRNVGLKILLFNNRIYGLTKGQYSPTSERGKTTASTPMGSLDYPFSPIALALGARASFVARSIDVFLPHLEATITAAAAHRGTAMVEIYQNCNIFNDDAFKGFTDKAVRSDRILELARLAAQCSDVDDAMRLWKKRCNFDLANLEMLREISRTPANDALREFYQDIQRRDSASWVPQEANRVRGAHRLKAAVRTSPRSGLLSGSNRTFRGLDP